MVDDLHIAFDSVVYLREALHKFIDDDLQPGDLVAILHTSGGLGVTQQFTSDRRVLHANVDRLHFYLLGGWGLEADLAPWAPHEADFRRRVNNAGTMAALKYVLGGLRDLPGRKAVFLVSEGFSFYDPGDRTHKPDIEQQQLREIADLANRSATVVYTLSAQGLPTLSGGTSTNPALGDHNLQSYVSAQELIRRNYSDALSSMAYLAEQTEGLFRHDSNDLAAGLHELVQDLRGYYLIGYKPDDDTFKADKGGRAFHNIQVKVNQKGLHVRTRKGFFGVPDSEAAPVYRTREEQLRAAVVSPFGTSDVHVQIASQFLQEGSTESVARLRLHIDAHDLTFEDAPDGSKKVAPDLLALAYGDNGKVVTGFEGKLKGDVPRAEFETVRQNGVNYSLDLHLKEPGGYQVRVAVRDPATQKFGAARQFIEIPHLQPDRLTLSGIVLNAQTLGERGPAMRQFKAGDRVRYELEIYNPAHPAAASGPQLEKRIQIFREGQAVSEQDAAAITPVAGDANRLAMSGEFTLPADTAPGDYALLVTVIDKLAPQKHAAAHQWIEFEVVP